MNLNNIRNFAIIAHVDHGKSTLADRFLEITGTIPKDKMREQFLDQNPISRKRGITIKLAPVRMKYILNSEFYILNLIDTPGHVDFSYEVSRTLAACEGAVLLVDGAAGIQAQTVAHFREARKENLILIPVITKIDLPNERSEEVAKELVNTFGFKREEILYVSGKTGENVQPLLSSIVQRIPSPQGDKNKPLRALIFDASYDDFQGVIVYVKVIDGEINKNDQIRFFQNGLEVAVADLGFFSPNLVSSGSLQAGEIGYLIPGVKDIRKCRVGDTITEIKNSKLKIQNYEGFEPLPGYKMPKPMVFFGMYPKDSNDFIYLRNSLEKLVLNDTSLTYTEEHSSYLGSGFRVGFLGLLHAEIVKERIKQEFNLDILLTLPHVLYRKEKDPSAHSTDSTSSLRAGSGQASSGQVISEPYMKMSIYTPNNYVGKIMEVCQTKKGLLLDLSYHEGYAVVTYELPFSMFIRGLTGSIKSVSNGFASIDYELTGYKKTDLVSLTIKINEDEIDVLSELVYRDEAIRTATEKTKMLKNTLPRQQFRQIVQGVVEGKIVAREEIPPFRKDVLAKMSGGDRRRKDKLLEKQKKGKKKLQSLAKIDLPQEALISLLGNKN